MGAALSLLVAGCHGGAGTSTLARELGAVDAGPVPFGAPWIDGRPARQLLAERTTVLVVRGTAGGMRALTALLGSFEPSNCVLAVVDDGPWPQPPGVRAQLRASSVHVPVVRVPYVTAWRFDAAAPPSRAYRHAAQEVAAAALHVASRTEAPPEPAVARSRP